MGFQTQVNIQQAPAVAGDFGSSNPRASVVASEAAFVAGSGGVTIGKFAWISADDRTVQSYGTAPNTPHGFVHRDMQGLIQTYLEEFSNNIPEGFPVTLFNEGDFFATVGGTTDATRGADIYAAYSDGSVTIGSAATGGVVTASIGSTNTAALGSTSTGTANVGDATQIDITSVTGLISIGEEISGTGITAGTTIVSQVSGTTGGAGTYQLSASNTASSATCTTFGDVVVVSSTTGLISIGETISGGAGFPVGATVLAQVSGTTGGAGVYQISDVGTAYTASASGVTTFGNVLNVTGVTSGVIAPGQPISGTGVPASAILATQVSGTTGDVGVYTFTPTSTAYAAATAVTSTGGVLTNFKAQSNAAVGELVKISTWG
jgi:hypothetical protein